MNPGERIVGEVSLAFANLSANMTTEGLAIHNQALRRAADDINGLLSQLDAARAEVERLRAEIPPRPDNADRLIWLLKTTDAPPFSIGDDQ